jgi:peptide/nickel transport system substrate-binding protein
MSHHSLPVPLPAHRIGTPLTRRTLMAGSLAAGAVGLAACGDQKQKASGQGGTDLEERGTSDDLDDLVDKNEHDVEDLDKGGSLTLTIGSLGPNFNESATAGNSADIGASQRPANVLGVWDTTLEGEPELNKNFCTDAKYDDSGDKPVITYTLNPDAQFNDGTPFDWKVFENVWHMMSGEDPDIDAVSTEGYDKIEKVEAGKDDREVVVTMKEVYQPWTDLFGAPFHPDINTKKIFNDGFVNDMHPEWLAGPYEVDKLDLAQKRVILKPNEKWWGEEPILDEIVFQQMDSDSTIPAFRNGEIDGTGLSNVSRYKEAEDIKDKDIRRGQDTGVFGFNFNTTKGVLKDIDVRKAICHACDRQSLADLKFNGMNWTEELPGSWLLVPFSPYYENNFTTEYSPDKAKETLDGAGWTGEDGKVREKDGKKLEVSITTFGDDPVSNAIVQNFQKNLKDVGFDAQIDNRGDGDFNQVMEERTFQLVIMGYSLGADPTGGAKYFFGSDAPSNATGTGSKEIDKMIPKVAVDPDIKVRAKLANEVERKFQELHAMIPLWNGPTIEAFKPGLANYGPALYETRDWSKVGWEKGKKQG